MSKSGFFRKYIGMAVVLLAVAIIGAFFYPHHIGPSFPQGKLVIQRSDGQEFSYQVEIAATPELEHYGLMFRRTMPSDAGMIFLIAPAHQVSMWMKNTYLPLDMLFVKDDGTITKIVTNTTPLDDKTVISSDEPVGAVIELNAGQAEKNDFKVGDKVLFPGLSGPL